MRVAATRDVLDDWVTRCACSPVAVVLRVQDVFFIRRINGERQGDRQGRDRVVGRVRDRVKDRVSLASNK